MQHLAIVQRLVQALVPAVAEAGGGRGVDAQLAQHATTGSRVAGLTSRVLFRYRPDPTGLNVSRESTFSPHQPANEMGAGVSQSPHQRGAGW